MLIKALLERVIPALTRLPMKDVIAGDANQAGEDNRNVARMAAALLAGLPVYRGRNDGQQAFAHLVYRQ